MSIDLPAVGARVEGTRLDIKGEYPGTEFQQKLEMAKDIAAFANGVGGQVIVGVYEDRKHGTVARYAPLAPARVTEVYKAFHLAVEHYLRPHPVYDVVTVPAPGETVDGLVIVEVQPFPGQAVGVRVPIEKKDEDDNGEPAYRFPVRVGERTVYFEPHQLGLIMDASYRRIAQILAGIPLGSRMTLRGDGGGPQAHTIVKVDVMRNVFFVQPIPPGIHPPHGVPIDSVTHAYPNAQDGDWVIFYQLHRE